MNYIWIDIETTGLDPLKGYILEVAMVATTGDFEALEHKSFTIDYEGWGGYTNQFMFDSHCNAYVADMHTKNGLKKEFIDAQNSVPLNKVAQTIDEFVKRYWDGDNYNKPIIAGSNPNFDKFWLEIHFPILEELFHYRVFDMNTLYMFFNIEKTAGRNHRALADILADLITVSEIQENYEELIIN